MSCRVLERSNAVGGRAATLEWHGVRVDPGLPFLHARSAEFGDVLNELDPSGKVVGWPSEVITPRLAALPDSLKPGYRRMARRAGIGEFAARLGRGADVRFDTAAHALAEDDGRLVVETATGDRMAAPFVVVATPIAECLRLCASLVRMWPDADTKLARLRTVRVVPTVVTLAGYDAGTLEIPFHIWYPLETVMIQAIVNDSSKRDPGATQVLAVHARSRYSAEALGQPVRDAEAGLLWELGELLGAGAAAPRWRQTIVWPQAWVRSRDSIGQPMVFESPRGGRLALIGDAFANDAGLEGAYMSGLSIAEQIATLPAVRERVGGPPSAPR